MTRFFTLLLVIACLYALGALTLLVAGYLGQYPTLKAQVIRLGEAACTFALGFMGLMLVVIVLRSVGLLPSN